MTTHYVYICFDADGHPLYVGHTNDVAMRLKGHRSTASWYEQCARVVTERYDSKALACEVERRLIADFEPEFNVLSNPGRVTLARQDEAAA